MTSIFSSSSECTSEWRLGAFSPSARTTARPMPFSSVMNGQKSVMKSSVGLPTIMAVRSACWSAIVFGASSPSTMCRAVMRAKPTVTATVWAVTREMSAGRKSRPRSMSEATVGSPIQPRPRLDIVMASWVAAM